MATYILEMALPIAIRYSAVRRQFGPNEDESGEEIPVIEYPLQVTTYFFDANNLLDVQSTF